MEESTSASNSGEHSHSIPETCNKMLNPGHLEKLKFVPDIIWDWGGRVDWTIGHSAPAPIIALSIGLWSKFLPHLTHLIVRWVRGVGQTESSAKNTKDEVKRPKGLLARSWD